MTSATNGGTQSRADRLPRPAHAAAVALTAAVVVFGSAVVLVSACTTSPRPVDPAPSDSAPVEVVAPVASVPSPAADPALPLPTAGPFAEVVARAGEKLLRDARAGVGSAPRDLVVDPLLDASTGQQTAATVQMAAQLATLIRHRTPEWTVRPFVRGSLATKPLLLIGTLTALAANGGGPGKKKAQGADAFRVCLALVDLTTGKLVAKAVDRATPAGIDALPLALYRDSPTWTLDRTTRAYIQSCQGSQPGDAAAASYLRRLPAATLLNEAQQAYAENRVTDAYRLFRDARGVAEADDLRVLNGLYVASWRSGRKTEAAETFGRIVGIGMEARRLPVKLLFAPGTTRFVSAPDLQAQYAMWLREIALQAGVRENCMRVVGHTSRSGNAAVNDLLSARRALVVKQALERLDADLVRRLVAVGVGSREAIVGLGTDDGRDALDRRVELRTVDCA